MDTEIRVLIADDEQIARETMRDYLPWAEMGMQTPICVENGALALDHLCHDKIDIFIMDIRMPIMDGMALLEEITRRNIDVLIIVLSAYDQFEYAQKAISSRKVFEYVLKPIRRFCKKPRRPCAASAPKAARTVRHCMTRFAKIITDSLCRGIPQRASPWSDKSWRHCRSRGQTGRQKALFDSAVHRYPAGSR